jgi:malonyl-CoA/methylmalonyl-CoA synthetase
MISLMARAEGYGDRTAIVDREGAFTYRELIRRSESVASGLLGSRKDLEEDRVAFLTPRGFTYAACQWGIWRAGGIAVPLCELHPPAELSYAIQDADASVVVAHPEFAGRLQPIAEALHVPFLVTDEVLNASLGRLPEIEPERRAMILYTSGTTGRPKGVVTTHLNLEAQITSLVEAWEWTPDDYVLHVLPLHHVHGIINILACSLWVGARCKILPRFDARDVWQEFMDQDLTLFMAVPTVYVRLMAAWEGESPERRRLLSRACRKLRLTVSGSAALPVSVFEKWKAVSGHDMLERYGMTEIGMALGNPLDGRRVPGHVGSPLPQVKVRLVDEHGYPVSLGSQGEIQVRGPTVFLEYWRRPDETRKAFRDGWFQTGDVAVEKGGIYRILGRKSTDIIKTGGYKVSALEIEETLRSHPAVQDCAVVGLEDPEWGERVSAGITLREGEALEADALRGWAKERLAPYKVPSRILFLEALPRNAMGKITKPALKELLKFSAD